MEKARPRYIGRPKRSDQILYILNMNNGKQKRSIIREKLQSMGYAKDCYFQAF